MNNWIYNHRSQDALNKFTASVNKRKDVREFDNNKWLILFPDNDIKKKPTLSQKSAECVSLVDSQGGDGEILLESPDGVTPSKVCDINLPMEIVEEESEILLSADVQDIKTTIDQMKIDFRVVKDTNVLCLEKIFENLNFELIVKKLQSDLCKQTITNICIAFLSISPQTIEHRHLEVFLTRVLLPLLKSSEVNRNLEQSILEHIEKNDEDLFKYIFIPLMTGDEESCIMTVAVISKINMKSKEILLREFLKHGVICKEAVLPVILILFKTIPQLRMSDDITEMMISFLVSGSEVFRKNINYGKIVHTVSQTLKDKFVNIPQDSDMRRKMIKVINDNETPFKNSCKTLLGL